jgi:hypothetical protein
MPSREELLTRALGYPYAAPRASFLLAGERILPLEEADLDVSGRGALIAYGSNASPAVLRRKLGPDAGALAAVRAVLHGYDAVYSAHVSAYGAVPATLVPCAGVELPVFVLQLSALQLATIAATEPNYERRPLSGAACEVEGAPPLRDPVAYVSRHGPLLTHGSPIAVAAIEARGRTLRAAGQRAALEAVRLAVRPGADLETFVVETASDPELPARWTASLRSDGGEAAQREPGEGGVGDEQDPEMGERPA